MDPRKFPGRLHHAIPSWAPSGALFHIRIRADGSQSLLLTDAALGPRLLESVRHYQDQARWWCRLVVLMPDHLHAMLAFPLTPGMSATVRNWKRATARLYGVRWQSNFFDHRIRHEAEADETWTYLGNNPVVKGLTSAPEEWPWRWSA
jgi:REP element-mobilizing transposase RayT